jgi:hypothetical protein
LGPLPSGVRRSLAHGSTERRHTDVESAGSTAGVDSTANIEGGGRKSSATKCHQIATAPHPGGSHVDLQPALLAPELGLLLGCARFRLPGLGSRQPSIIATSGTVVLETSPYPSASDSEIFAFDEQQLVAFVATQGLDFGSIAPGTMVNSHYIQYDTASATGTVGAGSLTFDGVILGVITSTSNLTSGLRPRRSGDFR